MEDISSAAFFKLHWVCWVLLGAGKERVKFKAPYVAFTIVLNTVVTLLYPMHLIMAVFMHPTQAELMKCLATSAICLSCSVKFVIFVTKMRKIQEFEGILRELDARVQTPDERNSFTQIGKNMRNITYIILSVFFAVGLTAELSFFFRQQRSPLYPGWFPFDWRESEKNFYMANAYQIFGISTQILQNYTSDCFPPMALCLLTGHTKLLGIRVAKIGQHSKSEEENEETLRRCIADQKNLYRLFDTIQDIISWPMFIQFTVTAFNICLTMASLLFYAEEYFDALYNLALLLALPLEIFPVCYYGSKFQSQFSDLPYSVFSCNWVDQSRRFKKHMIIFSERSRKPSTAYAGSILRIHLDTFYATCKGAYSLFTVIMKMKK